MGRLGILSDRDVVRPGNGERKNAQKGFKRVDRTGVCGVAVIVIADQRAGAVEQRHIRIEAEGGAIVDIKVREACPRKETVEVDVAPPTTSREGGRG